MQFLEIHRDQITPNSWNPNSMEVEKWNALILGIKQFGFNLPVIVRKKEGEDGYEIIDGEHRYKAFLEDNIPCIVLEVTDLESKALTIGLNNIRGDINNLDRYGDVVKEVFSKYGLEKTKEFLGNNDLSEFIEIAKSAEGIKRVEEKTPIKIDTPGDVIVKIELSSEQKEDFEKMLSNFKGGISEKIISLCSEFILTA